MPHPTPRPRPASRGRRRRAAAVLSTTLVTACWPTLPGHAASDGTRELMLRFNGSGSSIDLTNSGTADLVRRVAASGGGTVQPADGMGRGWAARLPRFGEGSAAIVVTPRSGDPLSPGTRPFTFGAHFELDATSEGSSSDNGNNLVQRGLYDGEQYKLQVDGRRVSCRVSGSQGAVAVSADRSVAPDDWYRAACTRSGDRVTLELTRYASAGPVTWSWTRSGATGALDYDASTPLSIGAKVANNGNVIASDCDQLNGRVDNAFFQLL